MEIQKTRISDKEVKASVSRASVDKGGCPFHAKRTNSGNPNAMTGKGKGVITSPPTDKSQKANTRTWKDPLHWKSEGYPKNHARKNPARPDRCTAKTYTRTNQGAARS